MGWWNHYIIIYIKGVREGIFAELEFKGRKREEEGVNRNKNTS